MLKSTRRHPSQRNWWTTLLLSVVMWGSTSGLVVAASPETAPAELKNLLMQIDETANRQDLEALMAFYSESFQHSDGLTPQNLRTSLTQLWQNYTDLNYETELTNWEQEGDTITAETITTITGMQTVGGREMRLLATIRSQQHYQGNQIIEQTILAEQTQIKIGENPPTVIVYAPDQVKVNQEYNFDAIVEEPLGEQMLMGAITQERIQPKTYFNQPALDWELLNAGGLFKLGQASRLPENTWISAVLIRPGGITLVNHRLQVVD